MLADDLKTHTREEHQALEATVIRRIKAIRATEDYATLLRLFYGYYAPLEQALEQSFNQHALHIPHRRKSSSLLTDIAALDISNDVTSHATKLPRVDTPARAWGALYVLEGSTLGGQFIAKMLTEKAGMPAQSTRFFSIYGNETMAQWEAFKASLNEFGKNSMDNEDTIQSARETFDFFQEWLMVNEKE